jgi:hypothetical protein
MKIDYGKDRRRRKAISGVSLKDEAEIVSDDAAARFLLRHDLQRRADKKQRKIAKRMRRQQRRMTRALQRLQPNMRKP